jgi:hypothetical protein
LSDVEPKAIKNVSLRSLDCNGIRPDVTRGRIVSLLLIDCLTTFVLETYLFVEIHTNSQSRMQSLNRESVSDYQPSRLYTIRPSRILTILSAYAAASGSCVIIKMV